LNKAKEFFAGICIRALSGADGKKDRQKEGLV